MNDSIDLAELDTKKGAEEGFELQLVNPKDGTATPGKIRVLGKDCDAYQDAKRSMERRAAERFNRTRKLSVSPDQVEAEALDLLVLVTVGWSGLALGGAVFEYSPENARTLFTRFPWIREQVDQAVADRENFLPASAKAS